MTLLCLMVLGLFVFLVIVHQRAKRALGEIAGLKQVNARAWEALTARIRALEEELGRLKASRVALEPPALDPEPAPTTAPPPPETSAPLPIPEVVKAAAPPLDPAPPRVPVPAPTAAAPKPTPPRPQVAPLPARPGLRERLSAFNWEELLGTQVFLRLGVAVVVLGVVLFLGYVFAQMGPAGKVAMGVGAAFAMIAGGLYGESKEGWRTFGRVILAGGWGVLYFTAFAMRFLAASQVIHSTPGALLLLIGVAGGAVLFSLRYRQEWTTAFAFLLIYLSLGMAAMELRAPFTLPAVLIASGALGYLAWRMGWSRLLGLGAFASWTCLGLGAAHATPGGFSLPVAWLCLLITWAAFVWPVLAWRAKTEEAWLGATLVASGMALMGLGLREGFAAAPAQAWFMPLLYGTSGLAASFTLRAQSRRGLFKTQALMALLALGLAGPLRLGFQNGWLPVMRMLGLEALLATGIFLRERFFRLVALAGFLLTFVEVLFLRLGFFGAGAPEGARLAMLIAATALSLANAALLRRAWRAAIEADEGRWAPPLFSIAGATFLACLIWQHAPHGAAAVLLLGVALAFQEAALASGHGELPWLALGLGALSILALFAVSLPALAQSGGLRRLLWATSSAGFYLAYGRAALSAASRVGEGLRRNLARIQLCAGLGLALWLVAQEAPAGWVAPLLALLALVHLWIGWRSDRVEWIATSAGAWFASLWAVLALSWTLKGRSFGVDHRLLSVGGLLALGYAGRWLLRRGTAPASLASALGWALALTMPALLSGLLWAEAPALWAAPLMALALLLHALAALKGTGGEGLLQVAELFLASLLASVLLTWPVGSAAFFSPRLGSLALAFLGWYLAHFLFHRAERREHPLASGSAWPALVEALAILGALGLALVLKGEALAHDKNLLVALAWGLLGVLHLEGGRALGRRAWFWTATALMGAGAAHLLLVNVPQSGGLHGLSYRSLTVLPFLALMAYAHATMDEAGEELGLASAAARWKALGIFAGAALGASYLLYELHRAWVIAAWAALALGYIGTWLRWRTPQLRGSALGLLGAILVRAVGVNLALRDELQGLRLNLLVVPATCVLLLICFLLLNREEHRREASARFGAAGSRLWLLGLLLLTTAHFWAEASGKALTIWWSLEGLAAVALGFLASERWSRLAGLSLLSFCILKLFVYDLRGLEGMARILSFIVLGLVLVGVSWVYTRFKERLL